MKKNNIIISLIITVVASITLCLMPGCSKKNDKYTPLVTNKEERQLIGKGNKLYNEGNYQEAEIMYEKATQVNPNSPVANYNLALSLVKQMKSIDNDSTHVEMLVKADSLFYLVPQLTKDSTLIAMSYHNMGNIRYECGYYDDAIILYKWALRYNPNDDETRYNLRMTQLKFINDDEDYDDDDDNKDDDEDFNENYDEENDIDQDDQQEQPEQQQPEQQQQEQQQQEQEQQGQEQQGQQQQEANADTTVYKKDKNRSYYSKESKKSKKSKKSEDMKKLKNKEDLKNLNDKKDELRNRLKKLKDKEEKQKPGKGPNQKQEQKQDQRQRQSQDQQQEQNQNKGQGQDQKQRQGEGQQNAYIKMDERNVRQVLKAAQDKEDAVQIKMYQGGNRRERRERQSTRNKW